MTIDELRAGIDAALLEAIGAEHSRTLNVWVNSRSHRMLGDPSWDCSYSVTVENSASVLSEHSSLRIDRETPERLLVDFSRCVLPRVVAWFHSEVLA